MANTSAMPPEVRPGAVGSVTIHPGDVNLVKLEFARAEATTNTSAAQEIDWKVRFDFAVRRASENTIVVRLAVLIDAPGLAKANVMAQTEIAVTPVEGSQVHLEREMAGVAAQIGPVVIYPYLREIVADVTRRAGLSPITLPIYQIGTFFKVEPKDVELVHRARTLEEPTDTSVKKPRKKATDKAANSKSKKPQKEG